jgi:carboxyl-terminal processing protease
VKSHVRFGGLFGIRAGIAALVVACSGLALAQADVPRVQAAAKVAADAKLTLATDPLWQAARYGRWDEFTKQVDLLAAGAAGADAHAAHATAAALKAHIAQRETDRTKRIAEVREELTKNLAEPRTTITLAKLLRSATELQVLSLDKAAVMAEPQIREIVQASHTAANQAETGGDVFGAYELFSLLGALQEESGEYKADVRRLSQRLDMLRLYVPETLWKLRNDRQIAAGEKPLPPYNAFGDAFQSKLASIDASLVLRALGRATTHVEQRPINGVVLGGLEALRTMITTVDLASAFPKLADDKARDAMLVSIDEEVKRIAEQPRALDLSSVDSMIARLRNVNDATVQVPFYALLHEFGNGAMGKLDEFSAIIWPDELRRFQKMTQSSFVGVGIQIEYDESSNVRVVSPLEGTPAQRAGVHPGDILAKVDGRTIFGLSLDQAVDVITGPPGTDVVLTMQRKSETEKDEKGEPVVKEVQFRLTRAVIKVPTAKGWERAGIREDDWSWFIDKESGIGYIRLTQFADNTGKELDDAVAAMRKDGLKGLIFDLRFNPGGLLDQAVRIGRRFIDTPDGYIVAMRGPDGSIMSPEETMPERARLAGLPVVVLINEGSASASEIVSGAMKCFQQGGELNGNVDAVVLGARSYGKGSVQNVWPLTSDSAIKVTTQYYVIPNGSILHRRTGAETWGVEPNLRVEMLPKQTVDALLLRRNADVVPVDENGVIIEDKAKPRPKPQELLDKGLDLQLQAALLLMQSRIKHGTASTQAVK